MKDDAGSGKHEFIMDFVDEPETDTEAEPIRGRRPPKRPGGLLVPAAAAAGAALVIGLVIGYFFGGDGESLTAEDLKSVTAAVQSLESRVASLESMEDRMVQIERQATGVRQSQVRSEDRVKSLSKQMAMVSERVRKLETRSASTGGAGGVKPAGASSGGSAADPKYHVVTSGDTLYRISIKYGITVDELCRLNNISRKQVIKKGQRLIVSK